MRGIVGCYGITLLVVAGIIIWGSCFSITGDEMGYCLLNYYLIFPILTFTCGMKLGSKKLRYGIGYLFIVGILGVCMIGSVFHYLEWSLGITGILCAAAGLLSKKLMVWLDNRFAEK